MIVAQFGDFIAAKLQNFNPHQAHRMFGPGPGTGKLGLHRPGIALTDESREMLGVINKIK
jgi:hypothetical protein